VKDGKLVGIITERDFMDVSAELLEQKLKENQ
jgi:CBS domain-containing protein